MFPGNFKTKLHIQKKVHLQSFLKNPQSYNNTECLAKKNKTAADWKEKKTEINNSKMFQNSQVANYWQLLEQATWKSVKHSWKSNTLSPSCYLIASPELKSWLQSNTINSILISFMQNEIPRWGTGMARTSLRSTMLPDGTEHP